MQISFIETAKFTVAWTRLGLTVDELFTLQDTIGTGPTMFPVIPGTGGLRKMRFAKSASGKGKRGALRVCFVYFDRCFVAVLVWVYSKNEKSDLSAAEKKAVKRWIGQAEKDLMEHFGS